MASPNGSRYHDRVTTLDALLRARLPAPGDWQPTDLRRAAVLCPVVAHGGEDCLLLVVRPTDLQHAGQIAFPGGMRDGDEPPLATALRECREEVGVPAEAVAVLGELPPRASSAGIFVHCLVGRVDPVPLVADPREVVRVLHVPLAELRDEGRWSERPPPGGAGGSQPRLSPHFVWGEELLWGLTARFVRDLVGVLRG